MFKGTSVTATALSAFVFTTLCLLCSAWTATAQVEPQPRASNTSRNDIKNTSRTTDLTGQMATLRVELARNGGSQMNTGVPTQRTAYKIDQAGDFNFGFLPAGRYELRVTRIADTDKAAPPDTSSKKAPEEARASSITITLDGVKGGPLKKDLAVTPPSAYAETAQTRLGLRTDSLDGKIDSEVGRLYGPGKPVFGNITFETDGKREVKGTTQFSAAINSIINK